MAAEELAHVRKGFGLGAEVRESLKALYSSRLVEKLRSGGFRLAAGDLVVKLAREFGFCYGVDRAVEYAYEARRRFPDRLIHITGEIIHNPHVNRRLQEMGIHFLSKRPGEPKDYGAVAPADVVILPAF